MILNYSTSFDLPASLSALSRSNEPPSQDEQRIICDALAGSEATLETVREEIATLQRRLAALVDVEQKLATSLRPFQAIFSPFRRLPDDIIREIFLACVPTQHNAIISARHAPTVLSHISRHTRAIALATPRLWATLHIPVAHSQHATDMRILAVKEWLGRSSGCDLSISVYEAPGSSARVTADYILPLLKIIVPSSSRWRSLSLHASFVTIRSTLESLRCCTDLRFLQSFSMEIDSKLRRGEDPQLLYNASALSRAPSLKDVRLQASTSFSTYTAYNVCWGGLVHVSLGSAIHPIRMACLSQILQNTPQLRTAELYMIKFAELPPVCLPYLTDLAVAFADDEWNLETPQARATFSTLHLPTLERVSFDAAHAFAPLIGLLCSAKERIRHLSVDNLKGPLHLVECLRQCPHLQSLSVRNMGVTLLSPMRKELEAWYDFLCMPSQTDGGRYLFSALMPPDKTILEDGPCVPEALCPKLEYLSVVDRNTHISANHLLRLVQAKHRNVPILRGLILDVGVIRGDDVLTYGDFAREIAGGLNVLLNYGIIDSTAHSSPADEGIVQQIHPGWWPSHTRLG